MAIAAGVGAFSGLIGAVGGMVLGQSLGAVALTGAFDGMFSGQFARLLDLALHGQLDQASTVLFQPQDILFDTFLGGITSMAGYGVGKLGRSNNFIRAVWGHPNARKADINFDGFVNRVFKGDYSAYNNFVDRLKGGLPLGTKVYARGSSITGYKWTVGRPFDALGLGTSDLDLVLVGNEAMKAWRPGEFKVAGMYTTNLGEGTLDVAPSLNALWSDLQNMVGRPVNIQATTQLYLDTRLFIQGTKYLQILP